MADAEQAKRERLQLSRIDEERSRQEFIEQTRRLAQLAEIEQEKIRMQIEAYRRELQRQVIERKEMYEAARQAELERIERERDREERRQAMIEEERRSLVIAHLMEMGPEGVKYLPKGVLKEGDLDFLPDSFRVAILGSGEIAADKPGTY
jgi:hypothetical protein